MTTERYIRWILSAVCGLAVMLLVDKLTDRLNKKWQLAIIFIIKAFAGMFLAYELISISSAFVWKHNYILSGLYIALLSDCIADLIRSIISFFWKERPAYFRYCLTAAVTLIVFVYGTLNMSMVRAHELVYRSDKVKYEHSFVFLSDLHYGKPQSQKTVEKALKDIKDLDPDFIVLGGDITDEYTTKEEMKWIYDRLALLEIPVYYIYGNHDRQGRCYYFGGSNYTEEELAQTITDNGIFILQDEYVMISEDLVLLGREDPSCESRLEVSKLKPWPKESYVISIEHNPYLNDDILKTDADLQLSGHTHAGQYFPLRFVYMLARLNVVGEYRIGNTDLYVSPGIGGWGMPFRNESRSQFEYVHIMPQE